MLTLFLAGFFTGVIFGQTHWLGTGPAIPLADFGDADIEHPTSGMAATGMAFGYEFVGPTDSLGLAIFFNSTFFWNPFDESSKTQIESSMSSPPDNLKYSHYLGLPMSAGVNFSPRNTWQVSAGGVISFFKPTAMVIGRDVYKIKGTTGFGFTVGASLPIGSRVALKVRYYWLINHRLKNGYYRYYSLPDDKVQNVNLLTAKLAFRLGD